VFRSQRILLKPTVTQERLFRGSAGLSRFAWNWAVAYLRKHYGIFGRGPDGKTRKGYKAPSPYTLGKRWNRIKDRRFPWVREYSKLIHESSFGYVERAYQSAFARLKKTGKWSPPKFQKKGNKESFSVSSGNIHQLRRVGMRMNVPCIGFVKCVTPIRWPDAKRISGRVKLIAGRWWLILAYELPDPPKLPTDRSTCGIDLGCTTFATIASGGEVVEEVAPPKPYAKAKRKLKRLQRRMSRRLKGSKRKAKSRIAVAKAHKRIADIRGNFLHQLTAKVVKTYGTVVLEDLSVSGMMRGWLSGTIQDLGFGYFRQFITYKAEAAGANVVFADRFYPSSKTCHACGSVRNELDLSERVLWCRCGEIISRDHNAALNLEKLGRSSPEVTPVESGGSSARRGRGAARRNGNSTARKGK
jgi:putative transposase